jgi:pimeloyl-ACP methyl ester carboxylesterase
VTAGDLDVRRIGRGAQVVLVHGSIVGPERTWRHQLELASRWSLVIPSRPGFGASPPLPRGDFDVEAPMIAELLGDGAHLVGHSYGGVIALLAAAARPEAVRSLTVSEPGLLRVAAGDPAVDEMIEHGDYMYDNAAALGPAAFLRAFRAGVHSAHETPDQLDPELEHGARLASIERRSWEAEPPLGKLRDAPFPKLVISGGHSDAFETVCDALAEKIGAERQIIPGRGHTITSTGRAYNDSLDAFLTRSERQRAVGFGGFKDNSSP